MSREFHDLVRRAPVGWWGIVCIASVFLAGCAEQARDGSQAAILARTPDGAVVASLGNLRLGKPPSAAEAQLATFLFGVEPDAPLGLIKPMDLCATGADLLISEGALQAVLRWSARSGELGGVALEDFASAPGALAAANGDLLVGCGDAAVRRFSAGGKVLAIYRLPESAGTLRVGGIACVGEQVWVTNLGAHRIEVFDGVSGVYVRSIGRRGRGPGEFGFPLALAVSGTAVFVADMLNDRVQVLSADGQWVRDIGGPGDQVGRFGRPKAVAIGPDETVFVVDAASQRVHAFDREGRALLAFGGATDGADALVLPAGIAIWTGPVESVRAPPGDFAADYYVLVSEQISRPGVRVYGWHGAPPKTAAAERGVKFVRVAAKVDNPHWNADRCTACHKLDGGEVVPIARSAVDALCLSCHDGKNAIAEAHPIGRKAGTARTKSPAEWPLVDGKIACLTCHDMRGHCDRAAVRPAVNPGLVRGYDAQDPLHSCLQCHVADAWRVNPHRGTFPGMTSPTAACGFCHVSAPPREARDGTVQFDAPLKDAPTRLCLNCHAMHPDPAPRGHLGALVSGAYRRDMEISARRRGSAGVAALTEQDITAGPSHLPLDGGKVSCATCHNPHPADASFAAYFSTPGALARSDAPADAGKSLRMENMDLCRYCHPK